MKNPSCLAEEDCHGQLPLHVAMRYGAAIEESYYLLNQHKPAASFKDMHGSYPLHLAITSYDIISDATREDDTSASLSSLNRKKTRPSLKSLALFIKSVCKVAPQSLIAEDDQGMDPVEHAIDRELDIEIVNDLQKRSLVTRRRLSDEENDDSEKDNLRRQQQQSTCRMSPRDVDPLRCLRRKPLTVPEKENSIRLSCSNLQKENSMRLSSRNLQKQDSIRLSSRNLQKQNSIRLSSRDLQNFIRMSSSNLLQKQDSIRLSSRNLLQKQDSIRLSSSNLRNSIRLSASNLQNSIDKLTTANLQNSIRLSFTNLSRQNSIRLSFVKEQSSIRNSIDSEHSSGVFSSDLESSMDFSSANDLHDSISRNGITLCW